MSPLQFARFLRTDTLGASVTMVLLGAATSSSQLTITLLPALVLVAVSFHVYAYVLNDVVDLPIDLTDPRRRGSPLVTGAVSVRTAFVVALVQIPILIILVVWVDGGWSVLPALGVLVGAVSIYDVWGKRCLFPQLTDLIQGVAWGALGWVAAELTGGATGWTLILALYFVAFIMLANGVHGSIRDLVNDRRHGASTTAIWFGATPNPSGAVNVSGAYLIYALVLQVATVALALVPFLLGWVRSNWPGTGVIAVAGIASTVLLLAAAKTSERHRQLVLGAWHLILVLASVFLMVASRLPAWATAVAVACYVLPFASYRWLFRSKPQPGTHWTAESAPTR